MIDEPRPYPAYKDSGIEWLGEVPEHWAVLPHRAILSEVKERDQPHEEMLSVTITRGVIRQRDLLAGSSKKDSSKPDKSAYKLVQPGDVAYNKMRAWQGAIGASDHRGIVSPAYVVQRPRGGVQSRFLHYLYRTPAFAKEAERWSYGITSDMWSLRPEHFKLIYSCLPPLAEQNAIVRFLDHLSRRTLRVIRARDRLIGLLEEQKQALIHESVTGRIDVRTGKPYPFYKDSQIEWLGKVPEHWEVRRVKQVAKLESGHTPSRSNPLHWLEDNDIPWVSLNDTKALDSSDYISHTTYKINPLGLENSSARLLPSGVVVFTRDAGVGKAAITTRPMAVSQHLIAWICGPRIANVYLLRVFYAMKRELERFTLGATIPTIGMDDVSKLVTPVPPLAEQEAIAAYVQKRTSTSLRAIETTRREIDLLREYRARLIADVVTGKLDVREVAARLPEETEEPEPLDELEADSEADEAPGDLDGALVAAEA